MEQRPKYVHPNHHLPHQGKFVFVTVGGDKGVGHFLLAGDEEKVAKLGPKLAILDSYHYSNGLSKVLFCRVASILGGKGGGRKGRYQGKASHIENHMQAEDLVKHTLGNSTEPTSL